MSLIFNYSPFRQRNDGLGELFERFGEGASSGFGAAGSDPLAAQRMRRRDSFESLFANRRGGSRLPDFSAPRVNRADPFGALGAGMARGQTDRFNPFDQTGLEDSSRAAPRDEMLASGGDPTDQSWLRYANQNATRNDPLSQELIGALSFLGDMGITMEVFSGGQENNTTQGTGSTRHNGGNAADVFFYRDGRRLDWRNPEDIPIYQEIVRRARANGITGIGAGPGYMRPGSMHIGFGSAAVWGDNGRSANAPQWLREAYYG